MNKIAVGGKLIGECEPIFLIAEIGINHNGSIDIAKELIRECHSAGFDAVKFQKRDPDISTPENQKGRTRETPWGTMTYLEYKKRIEFGEEEYREIRELCNDLGILWFASPWDVPSAEFLVGMDVPVFKVASASVTDLELLRYISSTHKPVIMSTGMSTVSEILRALEVLPSEKTALLQATSSYPLDTTEANLRFMDRLREIHSGPIGYSGHEAGLQVSIAAAALGAQIIERHVTLKRTMWGTDHAASLEPKGFQRLVRDIRIVEGALGDGVKRVYDSEREPRAKLRRVQ